MAPHAEPKRMTAIAYFMLVEWLRRAVKESASHIAGQIMPGQRHGVLPLQEAIGLHGSTLPT